MAKKKKADIAQIIRTLEDRGVCFQVRVSSTRKELRVVIGESRLTAQDRAILETQEPQVVAFLINRLKTPWLPQKPIIDGEQ